MRHDQVNIRLTEGEKEALQKQAESEGRSQSGQIRWLIERRQKELDKEND